MDISKFFAGNTKKRDLSEESKNGDEAKELKGSNKTEEFS